jgi:hypothetical protein
MKGMHFSSKNAHMLDLCVIRTYQLKVSAARWQYGSRICFNQLKNNSHNSTKASKEVTMVFGFLIILLGYMFD